MNVFSVLQSLEKLCLSKLSRENNSEASRFGASKCQNCAKLFNRIGRWKCEPRAMYCERCNGSAPKDSKLRTTSGFACKLKHHFKFKLRSSLRPVQSKN